MQYESKKTGGNNPTVKDVARVAGLSLSTALQVLGAYADRYRPETQERIFKAAEQLGYRRHNGARTIATGKTYYVGLLLSNTGNNSYLPADLVRGVTDAVMLHGYNLNVTHLSIERLADPDFVPNILKELMLDGLLINYNTEIPDHLLELIERYKIPSVWLNIKQPQNAIHPADLDASFAATERFLELGHRQVAYIGPSRSSSSLKGGAHYSVTDRCEGYLKAMEAAGLDGVVYTEPVGWLNGEELAFARDLLLAKSKPTGLLLYGPRMLGALSNVATELGLRIPQDLSIATFWDLQRREVGRPVDTWVLEWGKLGKQAIEMLFEQIDTPDVSLPSVAFPYYHVKGQTLAKPNIMKHQVTDALDEDSEASKLLGDCLD
jgi:DNA-binding LacI/PurR family transcriptional regulator